MPPTRRHAAGELRDADLRLDVDPPEVVRREPFADNPRVGARGQRTQQRILDAALVRFGEVGYERCSIDSIADRAGCSRAALYQYFSSKEDVFRQLTGRAARQLNASTEALERVTSGASGWRALRAWITRFAEIHGRYEPLFHTAAEASETDEAVAAGSARWREWTVAQIRSRVADTTLRLADVEPVTLLLLEGISRTHDVAPILRAAAPGCYGEDRIGNALADVFHRSLFGLRRDVNVHAAPSASLPTLRFDAATWRGFAGRPPETRGPASAGTRTRAAIEEAGRIAFVRRGYHRTRIGDVVEAANVSRGSFYRYFEDKIELARQLATTAMRTLSEVTADFPAPGAGGDARNALRRWLRRYARAHAEEAAMLRVWVDASLQDETMHADSAAALDWGRRTFAPMLARRGFGDVEAEAVALVALLGAFGARERTPAEIRAAAHVIEAGFFGVDRES